MVNKKTISVSQKTSKTPVKSKNYTQFWKIFGLVALFICGVAIGFFSAPDYIKVKQETPIEVKVPSAKNCASVEEFLNNQLSRWDENSLEPREHLLRAELYARLMKRGCPENMAKYRELALREIEIARALNNGQFDNDEVTGIIDTYKKLNMQAEAQKVLDTFKKLTDPAIDFIIQAERIINEQNH